MALRAPEPLPRSQSPRIPIIIPDAPEGTWRRVGGSRNVLVQVAGAVGVVVMLVVMALLIG